MAPRTPVDTLPLLTVGQGIISALRPGRQPGRRPPGARYDTAVPRIVLYGKPGCHLCEDMRALVDEALEGTGLTVEDVDITRDLELFVRFRHDVPILEVDGREVARHRTTATVLAAALTAAGSSGRRS